MIITRDFEYFLYFAFETTFLENRNFFQKTELPFSSWKKPRIKSTTFPCKTVLSKVNVKTNRMGSEKWTCQKERSFATKLHIFFEKFSFSVRTSYNNWFNAPATLISIFILFVSIWLLVQCAFSLWVSLNIYSQWNKILTRLNFWNKQLVN